MFEPPYKKLLTYKYSVYVYDMNKEFLELFVRGAENMRQRQQMDQAARSSKQCLVEGAMQGASLKGYIKMLGISRGSYEELLEDYKDIARRSGIEIWNRDRLKENSNLRIFIKEGSSVQEGKGVKEGKVSSGSQPLPPAPPLPPNLDQSVNIMIDLITRTNYLFDQQKKSLEQKFLKEGGFTENLYKKRIDFRNR